MPYVLPDLNVARQLVDAGAAIVMPLAAPIGTNKGLATKDLIQILIDEIDVPVIIDAGIGRPSEAAAAMEMGADAIMANTSMATAQNIPLMAEAFRLGVEAGRKAYLAGPGRIIERGAVASSPLTGLSKWFVKLMSGWLLNADFSKSFSFRTTRLAKIVWFIHPTG